MLTPKPPHITITCIKEQTEEQPKGFFLMTKGNAERKLLPLGMEIARLK